jgi:uncharacterized membrane protein
MEYPLPRHVKRRRCVIAGAIAALCASLPLWSGALAAPAAPDDAGAAPDNRQRVSLYSVINLGPEASSAVLNERGQAAFSADNYFGTVSRFFDGQQIRPIGALGGGFSRVRALNNHGVVAGESSTAQQPGGMLGFSWTLAGGARALSGDSPTSVNDINDNGEIVGATPAPGVSARAMRWNPDGGTTPLGPLPYSRSEAAAINNRGDATGSTDTANGLTHATLWDRAGGQTDVVAANRGNGAGQFINERSEVAGQVSYARGARPSGFFWSRDSGVVPVGVLTASVADLNNRGEVAGTMSVNPLAFQWSLARGMVTLPLASDGFSDASDINDFGETVGAVQSFAAGPGAWRAVRWPTPDAQPIDLSARLFRAPPGLVLRRAVAINNNGLILADSNAGLVMLRPGRNGTDAPVLGPITGLPATVALGQELALTVDFTDNAAAQTHTASALWSDDCASAAPTVTESGGAGQARLRHRFCSPGYHAVRVVVTDSGGRATELQRDVVVEAPALAALSGQGTGRLNGRDGYRFVLDAVDGANQPVATAQAAGADRTAVVEGRLTLRQ